MEQKDPPRDRLDDDLICFVGAIDNFFIGTASTGGWPHVQHRGGPAGFLKVLDDRTLAFADYAGNRQYITVGNLSENDRAFLFLLDPARRQRIKLWGRARVVENDPALVERLFDDGYKARPERAILFTIEAWDVNCSSHIVTRFTEAELEEAFSAVQAKIAELEKKVEGRKKGTLEFRVGEKGGVSVYGLGRFPVTLYYEQWVRLLDMAKDLRDFLEENKHRLKLKDQ